MRSKALPLLITAALVLSAPSMALSQTPIDPLEARDAHRLDRMEQVLRELRAIVFQGRDSGKPVVVQPSETDDQLQQLTRRMGDLEQALTRINGQLEVSAHDLSQSRREIEGLRRDNKALADRATALETQAAQTVTTGGTTSSPTVAGSSPDLAGAPTGPAAAEAFAQARNAMLGGDYTGAEAGFQDYVARYGESSRASEARYWLGKTLVVRGAYADAAGAFIGAIRGWPQTSWAPDAVVELSRALVQLKKPAEACQTLAEMAKRYPKAPPTVAGRAATTRTLAKCAA